MICTPVDLSACDIDIMYVCTCIQHCGWPAESSFNLYLHTYIPQSDYGVIVKCLPFSLVETVNERVMPVITTDQLKVGAERTRQKSR